MRDDGVHFTPMGHVSRGDGWHPPSTLPQPGESASRRRAGEEPAEVVPVRIDSALAWTWCGRALDDMLRVPTLVVLGVSSAAQPGQHCEHSAVIVACPRQVELGEH